MSRRIGLSLKELIAESDCRIAAAGVFDLAPEAFVERDELSMSRCVLVVIRGKIFVLELDRIEKIEAVEYITPLPNIPKWILGVVSIRGEVISVVDLVEYLSVPSLVKPTADIKVAVLSCAGVKVALLLDKVIGSALLAPERDVFDAPMLYGRSSCSFLKKCFVKNQEYVFLSIKEFVEQKMVNWDEF